MTDKLSTPTDVLDATQKLGEQWVSAVKQGQSVALDVARAFAGAWTSVPSNLPENPVAAALPDVSAITAYGFDLASELLGAQKDFAVALVTTLTPEKADES
jgi:DICT domain-containing protein